MFLALSVPVGSRALYDDIVRRINSPQEQAPAPSFSNLELALFNTIGDRPIGAGVAAATPDKERNLSTRNQKVMNKELFIIIKQFMMPERQS